MPVCTLIPTTLRFPGVLAPGARHVAVVGSFNGWNAAVHPLTRTPDGDWTITVYLPATRIVYGFDVDGTFWLDPFDEARLPNAWGSEYSVRSVRPADTRSPTLAGDLGSAVPHPAPGARERATQAEGVGR
jgi:predicted carbohydrate-binding protein with CBM48